MKSYIVEYNKVYPNGDVYAPGCFTNIPKIVKEDNKGLFVVIKKVGNGNL